MRLFEELKRRNVFRVGIAYAIVAWLVLQVADLVLDNIDAPGWVMQTIMLVVAIGFPLVLVFAWVFEMTPEGLKRESEVDRSQSLTTDTGRKLNTAILVLIAAAVAFLLIDRFRQPEMGSEPFSQSTGEPTTHSDEGKRALTQKEAAPSIAVLPFVNMSNDPEQEFFSDGISEELLNLLVRVNGLQVASRTSSFTYKGENLNIPQIASELKVNHILEGSVRKAGNRVRITAQLIETASDRHLWSDTFDRELTDIFAIQDEIANAIVAALQETLGIGLQAVSVHQVTENLDAYELYLKARGLFIARQNLAESVQLFEKATELDPVFAQAWEGLAAAHSVAYSWLPGDGIDHLALADEAADRALELDPDLSMPYAVKGSNATWVGLSYGYSVDLLTTAIEKDPKNATAWLWRGLSYKELGYMELASQDLLACIKVDPAYLNCKQHLAETYLNLGQEQEALKLLEETLEANFYSATDSFIPYFLDKGQRMSALMLASASVKRPYAPIADWVDMYEHPEKDPASAVARWEAFLKPHGMTICDQGEILFALKQFDCLDKSDRLDTAWSPYYRMYREREEFRTLLREKMLPFWRERGFPPQCRPVGEEDFECD